MEEVEIRTRLFGEGGREEKEGGRRVGLSETLLKMAADGSWRFRFVWFASGFCRRKKVTHRGANAAVFGCLCSFWFPFLVLERAIYGLDRLEHLAWSFGAMLAFGVCR